MPKEVKTWYLFAFLFLFAINVFAQKENNKILFMEFRFIKGIPQLISMTAVNSKLKTRKENLASNQGYSFEVLSGQEKILYKNNFENPAEIIYEYPGENGAIKKTEIKRDSANVTLRVPYSGDIDKVILYRNTGEKSLSKTSENSSSQKYEFRIDHSLIKEEY